MAAGPTLTERVWLRNRWLVLILLLPLGTAFVSFVDLTPRVTKDFFFSTDSPDFQEALEVDRLFPVRSQLIISATGPDLQDPAYFSQIEQLSNRLKVIPGVTGVKSLSEGPGSAKKALESALWKRLLIGDAEKSSLIILFVDDNRGKEIVAETEILISEFESPSFELRVSGTPFIVEMIRQNLTADLKTFSMAALVVISVLISLIFRSLAITVGTVLTCFAAIMMTLLLQTAAGFKLGALTANLSTIVFVLTQSHIVYLASNWRARPASESEGEALNEAVRYTASASVWCMLTTLLGFGSLLFVEAQPLRELGIGGVIGTVVAMAAAYLFFPAFLGFAQRRTPSRYLADSMVESASTKRWLAPAAILILIAAGAALALPRLQTDPSLLSYFDDEGQIREGLEFIDANGGSSPLKLVIRDSSGERLDNEDAYNRMWAMQNDLNAQPGVGTILSLPVLMKEGDDHWLASLLPWDWLIDLLSKPQFEEVARQFITEDRTQALFLLRMHEAGRDQDRLDIVADISETVRSHGFEPSLTGGVYFLQGKLAENVTSSLTTGLGVLVLLFGIVAFAASRSPIVGGAMMIALTLIPLALIGGLAAFSIPVDIISAPAANVAIGVGVDAMIHLAIAARAAAGSGRPSWNHWVEARRAQMKPTIIAAGVIAAGFAIFALSGFPPTQRFGVVVAAGAVLAAATALLVLPLLATLGKQGEPDGKDASTAP
ncbi:MAG: efflux RND transporter permease subunit [Alphaproteobacteria bacterium]